MPPSLRRVSVTLLLVVGLAAALDPMLTAASAPSGSTTRLPGHVLPALARATRLRATGDVAGGPMEPLTLTIVLNRDDQVGFDRYLREVYDPRAPRYRRFLTQKEITDRFGPSRDGYDRVVDYFRSNGFALVEGSANRLTLTVRGARADVERALQLRLRDYRIGERRFHANDDDPALPSALAARVQSIAGLSSLARPEPSKKAIKLAHIFLCALLQSPITCPTAPVPYKTCVKTENGMPLKNPYNECVSAVRKAAETDTDIAFDFLKYTGLFDSSSCVLFFQPCPDGYQPYGEAPPTGPRVRAAAPRTATPVDGTAQEIAIVGFDSFEMSDVADYLALVGLPASQLAKLSQVHVNGGAGAPGPDQDEVLLDVTTVMTLAPNAEVVVYDAPFTGAGTSFQALFNAAVDGGATVISNSWAYCEDQTSLADVQSIDTILANAAASGISVFNAAGDTGSTCLDGSPNTVAVPASSPHGVAVGGSSVKSGQGKARLSETWWNGVADTPPTGQGGFGVSRFFPRPSYQDGFTTSPTRSVPDVVASADPAGGVMICQASAGGCPTGALYGGTSFTAPLWAAIAALVNQAVGTNLGFANPTLYSLAATPAFNDAASLGSDFAHVGLGSPHVDRMIVLLRGETPSMPDANVSLVSPAIDVQGPVGLDVPMVVPADGVSQGYVVVTLLDADAHTVSGKSVSLAANGGSQVTITPASGVSDAHGEVVFTVTNLVAEDVVFTATDTTDGIELATNPRFPFVVPPAASGGINAFPLAVTANGVSATTITVSLQDALGRPTPGKEVTLSQGAGHSIITGPSPGVTDSNGQIQFTATNKVNEVVTYTAVDVSDGDLPVPGSAQVTFSNSIGSCVSAMAPAGQNGYLVTPFATGFVAEDFFFGNVNWGGCGGASHPAFLGSDVFISNFPNGKLYKLGSAGGAVSSSNLLATHTPTLAFPTVGKDGRLYATFGSTGGSFTTGSVVELDPSTGAILRTLAANQKCPDPLAVDPLSGDLFFTHQCFGAGSDDASLHRIRDPGSMSPTLELYATLPATPNGMLAFAPNGTLYVAVGYTAMTPTVVRVAGTDTAGPPAMTTLTDVPAIYTLALGEVGPDGEARSLIGGTLQGLELFDITMVPPVRTVIATNMGAGVIGPDGCLYAGNQDTVYKVSRTDGTCDFTPSTALPSLTLTPAQVTPDPPQGTVQELTATFHNLDVPEDTPVFFHVSGANPQMQMGRTDAAGNAELSYSAAIAGTDTVVATATVADETFASNEAMITWAPGKHTTFLTLNLSPTGGFPGLPAQVTASLSDTSVNPPAPIPGATVDFELGGAACSDTTDANGRATCVFVLGDAGLEMLMAAFDGTAQLLPASDAIGFNVVGGTPLASFTLYQTKPTKGTPKLVKFGSIMLGDDFDDAGYDVLKPTMLALPATRNGGAPADPDTHLEAYAVKRSKGAGKFTRQTDVHFINECNDAILTVSKAVSLLLPTAKDPGNPVQPPLEADHEVDHFLCYKAKAQKRRSDGSPVTPFPKGVQVDVADQFQPTPRRFDLKKLALLCNPVSKGGAPTLLAGPAKGSPFPIAPATIRHPASRLLCYTAKLAKKRIEQSGCGPATPGDKGTKIAPAQAKHVPRLGVHVANQFESGRLDTKKETLVCIPSVAAP